MEKEEGMEGKGEKGKKGEERGRGMYRRREEN